jgi:hypothetical protein
MRESLFRWIPEGFFGLRHSVNVWHSPICEKSAEILINFEKANNEAHTHCPS